MKISLPELSLVLLIGTSGCGKSTFGRKHFKPTEVVSSDFCRGLVADDENDQGASPDAFDLVHYLIGKRLNAGRLTVVDATNVQPEDRKQLIEIAREHNCLSCAIVFDIDEDICIERNKQRPERDFGPHVVRRQRRFLERSLRGLKREGFNKVFILSSPEEVDESLIERVPLWNNRKEETGPFDIIGDIHGCYDELELLLERLGYVVQKNGGATGGAFRVSHPENRRVIFVGDLVDRGPKTPDVLKLVMSMVYDGTAFCVAGNHDVKLLKALQGKKVSMTHGLPESLQQLEPEPPEFKDEVARFLDSLISHYVLDGGRLVVAHAGLKEKFQGRSSARVRDFCLYGETTGETDEYGLPIRYNWALDYRGKAMVVYGHTPIPEAEWLNHTICLDTGCVFGGELTALRYPEKELVAVPAARMYYQPIKPLGEKKDFANQARDDEILKITDVIGKRIMQTRLQKSMTIREENAIAALEVMSRWAVNPRWLIYLPPTMSPCGTSNLPGYLEHPSEAFSYYSGQGINRIVCEEKHMGSRAVIIICKDEQTAARRFGIVGEGTGVVYTRTGRPFFNDSELEKAFLARVAAAASEADLWKEFDTGWLALDCELMPWSLKAQELLRRQYASTGAAASASITRLNLLMHEAQNRGIDISELTGAFAGRQERVRKYIDAYRRYCWKVESLDDVKLAPFHLLATEGAAHFDKDHVWHMNALARLARGDGDEMIIATAHRVVNLQDVDSIAEAIDWWEKLTRAGAEGMVVKPYDFIAAGSKGFVQPAVKVRGSEYLRIIYGPEYDDERYLERLRKRGLSTKRSLAAREFALGVESVERFVHREPLYRIHECVFAVLALESEPVDPRL